MTLISDFSKFIALMDPSDRYQGWAKSNCGGRGYSPTSPKPGSEVDLWLKYRAAIVAGGQPTAPTLKSLFGQALIQAGVTVVNAEPVVPPDPTPQPDTPPGPGPNPTVTTDTVGLWQPGQVITNFEASAPAGRIAINCYEPGRNGEISHGIAGPSGDSAIIDGLNGDGTLYIHDVTVTGAGNFAQPNTPVHGIYECGLEKLERVWIVDSPKASNVFSIRWPNSHYRCRVYRCGYAFGIFDYSNGNPSKSPMLLRECLIDKSVSGYALYVDNVRRQHPSGNILGPNTIPVEIDHCTLDLRSMPTNGTPPINLYGDPGGSFIRNSVVVWDGFGPWYTSPKTVDTQGTVVMTSAQFALWLTPDYIPKRASGSPLVGKAVGSPPRSTSMYGTLPDVGMFPA